MFLSKEMKNAPFLWLIKMSFIIDQQARKGNKRLRKKNSYTQQDVFTGKLVLKQPEINTFRTFERRDDQLNKYCICYGIANCYAVFRKCTLRYFLFLQSINENIFLYFWGIIYHEIYDTHGSSHWVGYNGIFVTFMILSASASLLFLSISSGFNFILFKKRLIILGTCCYVLKKSCGIFEESIERDKSCKNMLSLKDNGDSTDYCKKSFRLLIWFA